MDLNFSNLATVEKLTSTEKLTTTSMIGSDPVNFFFISVSVILCELFYYSCLFFLLKKNSLLVIIPTDEKHVINVVPEIVVEPAGHQK